MDEEKLKFITSLLQYPEETALTEYKSGVVFDPKSEFGAKLIKHVLGLANTGGGYIVVGFQEDKNGKLLPDSSLTDDVSKSYETTRLSQSVDSFLAPGQRIELQVHKISVADKVHPVISVQGFRESPYFCGKEFSCPPGKPILREGAIYVRDLAAKTVVVAGPEHWNSILRTAVSRRQADLAETLRSMLDQLGISAPSVNSVANKASEISSAVIDEERVNWFNAEASAAHLRLKQISETAGAMEVMHYPVGISTTWDQSHLVAAAQRAVCRNTGWPIGVVMTKPEFAPKPTTFGIRAVIESTGRLDYWALEKRGAFYFLRRLDEDDDADTARRKDHDWVYFDTRIWRVAEAFLHCAKLYSALDLPLDTPISIRLRHSGLKKRLLGASNRARLMVWNRKTEEDEVDWTKTVPLGSIEAGLEGLVHEATNGLFVLFDFWQPEDQVFKSVISEFLRSRI